MNIGKCKNCEIEFKYLSSRQYGIYCSNKCQGEYHNKEKVLSGKCSFGSAKTYILKHWEYCCNVCNISEWENKEITLQLDHINGNTKDNRLSNLRWLCPNCHSQTDNWGTKNLSEKGRNTLRENRIRMNLMKNLGT